MKKFDVLKVKIETKRRLMEDCKQEFLEHHPDFEGMHLTQNFMVEKLVDYYLENN